MPPESICESTYGLSIARGSFTYARGVWTHVAQTVALNSPGVQNGEFYLEVNGAPVMDRRDVYYRGKPAPLKPSPSFLSSPLPSSLPAPPLPDDILSPLLGELLGSLSVDSANASKVSGGSGASVLFSPGSSKQVIYAQADTAGGAGDAGSGKGDDESGTEPIGFSGLFFRYVRFLGHFITLLIVLQHILRRP
jgi:hypothetical protein